MRKKYLKLISTDSIGLLGRPEQFVYLYKNYFEDGTFNGAEAIAFRPVSKLVNLISVLKKNRIKVISLHGRTGGENLLPFIYHVMMVGVNKTLLNAKETLANFSKKDILFHTPYSQNPLVEKMILRFPPKKLLFENHRIGKAGIDDTIKQISYYRQKGINVFGLIDIYHYVYALPTEFIKTNWTAIVNELEKFFKLKDKKNQPYFNAVHFPIGTRLSDSLPIEEMSDQMLELFAEKITPYLDRLVIENQVKNLGLIYSTKSMLKKQKQRNRINIKRLVKTGIL
ncbi:hypothetical protein HZA76_01100 [Candidatus Roizmanbacteria bacterium]|nr:hypothetical protein [Candidatus Roizmanbacteria bacterium]